MKVLIPDLSNAQENFSIDGKKDATIGIITTYISCEIRFHTSGIDFPHEVWKKRNSLYDKVDES